MFLAAAWSLRGGIVSGVTFEHISGRPLARTTVNLSRVPDSTGGKAESLTARTGLSGQFAFHSVAPGMYLLMAMHDGYFPVAYGQRLPIGRGTPIQVTGNSDFFGELRLRHKGAITGRVLDENGVGTSGVPILAYRTRLPLRTAGSAVSDDRGVYRIHGLNPGKYWVRSAAYAHDDRSGWLPTFGPVSREAQIAHVHQVTVDNDTAYADISPEPGYLFQLGGIIACDRDVPVVVTLSSETGRQRTEALCRGPYRFQGLSPGVYEVSATTGDGTGSGFIEIYVAQNTESATVQVLQLPLVEVEVRKAGANALANVPVTLFGRRQDLSETEPEHEVAQPRTHLKPGRWEFRAQAPSGYYVESITNQRTDPRLKVDRLSDWFDAFIEARAASRIRIVISDQVGQITGRVMTGDKPAAGVDVFLWPVAEAARRSLNGPLRVLSDTEGRFRFAGLPPGDYRALASSDVTEIDEELLEMSRAPIFHVEASETTTIELPVWIAPW